MSQPLELWLPVKPYRINQEFGANPLNKDGSSYYSRFLDRFGNPYKGHMGMDLQAYHGQPVHAPISGDAFYVQDAHGGDGLYIRAQGYTIILWHLCSKDDPQFKPLIPCDGSITKVECGQLIAYADNSGAPYESSGDHLHLGLYEEADPNSFYTSPKNPGNGYGGCIDPQPFLNMRFAETYMIAEKALDSSTDIVVKISNAPIPSQDKILLLSKVAQIITLLLHVFKLE